MTARDEPEEMLRRAVIRLRQKHGYFTLELGFTELISVIAHLQLALRHPGNVGESARSIRALIEKVIRGLEESEPVIGPLLRLGFDAAHDVPVAQSK